MSPLQTTQTPQAAKPPELLRLKEHLISLISRELEMRSPPMNERREAIQQIMASAYQGLRLSLPNTLRDQLFHEIMDDLMGFGPLQPLLDDPDITEVMVNGPKKVYVERKGKITKTNVTFDDDNAVIRVIEKIILPLGRRIDGDSPTVDARLPDGSRVNAVIAPVAIDGPSITIRKFQKGKLSVEQLIQFGSITRPMADFVRACVVSRL
ncbi:MAG TPA: ATPase, T2SS/T4P/T4SS family, partial [Anaerolineaceae bacterium]|nr:ATPase, T2SS/T4P/T4SS family [Anaerolineaceae bacterium]